MPLPIHSAHRLAERLTQVRKEDTFPTCAQTARPRSPSNTTAIDSGQGRHRRAISTQHAEDISLDKTLTPDLRKHVIDSVLADYDIDSTAVRGPWSTRPASL